MKKTPLPLPKLPPEKLSPRQVHRYRALMAFQLRSALQSHDTIAAVLKLRSREHSRSMVEKGRRYMVDCVINTVCP